MPLDPVPPGGRQVAYLVRTFSPARHARGRGWAGTAMSSTSWACRFPEVGAADGKAIRGPCVRVGEPAFRGPPYSRAAPTTQRSGSAGSPTARSERAREPGRRLASRGSDPAHVSAPSSGTPTSGFPHLPQLDGVPQRLLLAFQTRRRWCQARRALCVPAAPRAFGALPKPDMPNFGGTNLTR